MASQGERSLSTSAFCPHCHLLVERGVKTPWPAMPVRCPHCQLVIGAGRSNSEQSAERGARGAAAGIFSNQAKRDGENANERRRPPDEVLAAIRSAAQTVGERPQRLLMVDYHQIAVVDPGVPPLSDVIAAFGSWKNARRQASESTSIVERK